MTDTGEDEYSDEVDRLGRTKWENHQQYRERVIPLFEAVLNERGPLPLEGVHYFLRRDTGLKFTTKEAEDILFTSRSFERFNPESGLVVACWRTPEQSKVNAQPRLPIAENYGLGYYELVSYLQLIRENPEYLNAPLEQLRNLGVL
jgi:hypothetical protein